MALNAHRIVARDNLSAHARIASGSASRSVSPPTVWDSDQDHHYDKNTTLPHKSKSASRHAGLGSQNAVWQDAQDTAWRMLRTGETSAIASSRMSSRFVKATVISDPTVGEGNERPKNVARNISDSYQDADAGDQDATANQTTMSHPSEEPPSKMESLAELYASLAKEIEAQQRQVGSPRNNAGDSDSSYPATSIDHRTGPASLKQIHRSRDMDRHHHHRHDLHHRQRTNWFVTKALAKLQHSKQSTSLSDHELLPMYGSKAEGSSAEERDHVVREGPSKDTTIQKRKLCPTCGDPLPTDLTSASMALHRQSITHRLGLNAPVSSASASEANTPNASLSLTPLSQSETNSRATSPTTASTADASHGQDIRPHVPGKRRLNAATRWKKLKNDNVGYHLLSKMGWKEGMGLGIEEWKWQQLVKEKRRQRVDSIKHIPDDNQVHVKQDPEGTDSSHPIVLYSDEEEEKATDQAQSLEPIHQSPPPSPNSRDQGKPSFDWFDNLPRPLASAEDGYSFGDEHDPFQTDDYPHQDSNQAFSPKELTRLRSTNALLTPIEVVIKHDRKGLGSTTSRRRSRTSEGSVEIRNPLDGDDDDNDGKRGKARTKIDRPAHPKPKMKMTKRRRKMEDERKKREWLELRASLF